MTANDWSFETKQIHAGYNLDPATGATALPIYQTSSYAFEDTAQAASRFALQELGPIYTRLTNPTTDGVGARIAALEGGVGGLLVSSGQSATALSILALAVAGNNVVASPSLYGGSVTLLKNTLGRLGIEARYYTVVKGDTLSKIAKEYYGNANLYNKIFEANRPMLSHPDKIYPGQKLRIPPQ